MTVIIRKMIDDPMMTDAQASHLRSLRPNSPNIGKIYAEINAEELYGGFHRYKKASEGQKAAAARYLNIFNSMTIGGARAVNLEEPIVDTSFKHSSIDADYFAQAQQEYKEAVQAVGVVASALIQQVVIESIPQRQLAKLHGLSDSAGGRRAIETRVYDAMEKLAEHFHY